MKAHGAYGPKVNHLYLYLYFIRINKLWRARFCARGGKLNIANACIYARASYFRWAPRAEIARPRMHALAPTPLSLLPSPPPPPPLPPLPFLSQHKSPSNQKPRHYHRHRHCHCNCNCDSYFHQQPFMIILAGPAHSPDYSTSRSNFAIAYVPEICEIHCPFNGHARQTIEYTDKRSSLHRQ